MKINDQKLSVDPKLAIKAKAIKVHGTEKKGVKSIDPEEKFKSKDPAFIAADSMESLKIKDEIIRMQNWENHVISHELQHMISGGNVTGAPSYIYEMGPDGKKYVVGGKVKLYVPSMNTLMNDPAALNRLKSATSAPSDASPHDLTASAIAAKIAQKVKMKISQQKGKSAYQQARQAAVEMKSKRGDYVSALSKYKFQEIKAFDMML